MKLQSLFLSRWVRIPLGLVILLAVGAAGYVLYELSTSMSGMYHLRGVGQTSVDGASNGPAERLLYTSLRPANWDVYLFDELGAEPRRLTDHPNLDYNAVLSRDGRWVVFVSERDGDANLYALDLMGEDGPVALTSHPGMDAAPTLAPDGSRLAFVSTRSGNPDIYVMPFSPGNMDAETQAVNLTNDAHGDFNPAFSPDGSRLAFSSNRSYFDRWNPLRLVPLAAAALHTTGRAWRFLAGPSGCILRHISTSGPVGSSATAMARWQSIGGWRTGRLLLPQRETMPSLLAQRDQLITLLARADPAVADRLAEAYVS